MDRFSPFLHNGLVSFIVRISLPVVLFFGSLFLAMPLSAKTKTSSPATTDHDYVSALAVANRFLNAWQTQDIEKGLILLTDSAKHQTSEEHLQTFFSPGGDTQRAYELRGGNKLKDGRYSFPVTLLEIVSAQEHKWTHPRYSRIFVIKAGKDDWVIDKLP